MKKNVNSHLRILCHGVRLIENQHLEGRARVATNPRPHRNGRKVLDFGPDYIDAPVVTGVQLQHSGLYQLRPALNPYFTL
jgi:hypothetical protein